MKNIKQLTRILCMSAMFIFIAGLLPFTTFALSTAEFVKGDVRYQSKGSSDWQNVRQGQTFKFGDQLVTGNKSIITISQDGNKITINQNTRIKFTQDMVEQNKCDSIALFSGNVSLKMDRLKKDNKSYSVNTPSTVCAVRGTEFIVATAPDGSTILQVIEGSVSLSGESQTIILAQNQESTVKLGGNPGPIVIMKNRDWDQWATDITKSMKGNELQLLKSSLLKMEKLDNDIKQMEDEIEKNKLLRDEYKNQAIEANIKNDKTKAKELMTLSQNANRALYVATTKIYYQADKIDLVYATICGIFQSISKPTPELNELKNKIDLLRDKYYQKYIKEIDADAAQREASMKNKSQIK